MAEPKTTLTNASVRGYINAITDAQLRQDCRAIAKIMQAATGAPPRMWGSSIIGFGSYRCVYASGKTGDWPLVAFSPRARSLSLYIFAGFDQYESLLAGLGRHSRAKSCLYVKQLSDIHLPTLTRLVRASVRHMKARYPPAKRTTSSAGGRATREPARHRTAGS